MAQRGRHLLYQRPRHQRRRNEGLYLRQELRQRQRRRGHKRRHPDHRGLDGRQRHRDPGDQAPAVEQRRPRHGRDQLQRRKQRRSRRDQPPRPARHRHGREGLRLLQHRQRAGRNRTGAGRERLRQIHLSDGRSLRSPCDGLYSQRLRRRRRVKARENRDRALGEPGLLGLRVQPGRIAQLHQRLQRPAYDLGQRRRALLRSGQRRVGKHGERAVQLRPVFQRKGQRVQGRRQSADDRRPQLYRRDRIRLRGRRPVHREDDPAERVRKDLCQGARLRLRQRRHFGAQHRGIADRRKRENLRL